MRNNHFSIASENIWRARAAAQPAGWEGEMKLLGMAGGSTNLYTGCALPEVCCTGLGTCHFHPGLSGKHELKVWASLPLPGHDTATPMYIPEEQWLLWLLWPSGHSRPWCLHCDLLHSCSQPCQLRGKFALQFQPLHCVFACGHMMSFFSCLFVLSIFSGFQCKAVVAFSHKMH